MVGHLKGALSTPTFPFGNYEQVLIHDNWTAINRFVAGFGGTVRKHLLDRYVLYYLTLAGRGIALFATAMGSAQTNWLVEQLKAAGCGRIVKVGTCSALHRLRQVCLVRRLLRLLRWFSSIIRAGCGPRVRSVTVPR